MNQPGSKLEQEWESSNSSESSNPIPKLRVKREQGFSLYQRFLDAGIRDIYSQRCRRRSDGISIPAHSLRSLTRLRSGVKQ